MNRSSVCFSVRIGVQFLLVLALSFTGVQKIFASSFTDVPSGSPYYSAVESLKNLGVVQGYNDGTFRPDQAVNRAEALKMVLLTAGVQVTSGLYQTGFPDVKLSDWFSGYVFNGQNLKIVNGNPDGTFAPARQVNKAEFLKMTEQAFNVDLSDYQTVQYALSRDIVNVSDWYVPYFNYAKNVGIVEPTIDNRLEPGKYLSRADCAEILYKMYIVKNGGTTQDLLSTAEAKLVDALIHVKEGDIEIALTRAQEAVFYTDNAVKEDPNSNVTQGASLMAQGFEKLFEAYGAAVQKDFTQLKNLADEAKNDSAQGVAKDTTLQNLGQQLNDLADSLMTKYGV